MTKENLITAPVGTALEDAKRNLTISQNRKTTYRR